MKKLLAILLASSMLFGLAACADKPDDTTESTTTASSTTQTTEASPASSSETTASTTSESSQTTEMTTETTQTTETTEQVAPPVPAPSFDAENIVLSFGAISDIHVGNAKAASGAYFTNALKQLVDEAKKDDKNGLDAIIGVGDLTETYNTAVADKLPEIAKFKSYYESSAAKDIPFIYVLGNHDHDFQRAGGAGAELATFISNMGNKDLHTKYDVACPDAKNGSRHAVVGDHHFLFVEPVTYACNGADDSGAKYADETLAWLDAELAAITENAPDQYVFVMTHAMIYDTVYGSDLLTSGIYWYTKSIKSVLDKYPQVVTFGGHLHFPLNDPRSIHQNTFTSLGCGSVNYMAIEDGGFEDMASTTTMRDRDEFSQGLLVQVDKNGNLRITRMDFYNETTIGDELLLPHPAEGNAHLTLYTGEPEGNEAPALSEIRIIMGEAKTETKQNITIEFDAASDELFAHHYSFKLVMKDKGRVLEDMKILSDFYRHGDPADMRDVYSYTFTGLAVGTEYEVTLVAYDSWGLASEPVVTTFTPTGKAN